MIYDEKNRASLTWGGPVFYHARGSYFLFRQWKFMGKTPFPNNKLVMSLEKYRGAGRGRNGQASQSAAAGGWGLSSGKTPGGTNSAVDGMMTGEGMSGPDQATDIWSGPPSSL